MHSTAFLFDPNVRLAPLEFTVLPFYWLALDSHLVLQYEYHKILCYFVLRIAYSKYIFL